MSAARRRRGVTRRADFSRERRERDLVQLAGVLQADTFVEHVADGRLEVVFRVRFVLFDRRLVRFGSGGRRVGLVYHHAAREKTRKKVVPSQIDAAFDVTSANVLLLTRLARRLRALRCRYLWRRRARYRWTARRPMRPVDVLKMGNVAH